MLSLVRVGENAVAESGAGASQTFSAAEGRAREEQARGDDASA